MEAQRGHDDRKDVEPKIEVSPEPAFEDECGKVTVGCRDNSHVHAVWTVAADGAHLAELEDAQQLGLHAHRHVPNLVQKERATVGLREKAVARLHRTREGPAHVSE